MTDLKRGDRVIYKGDEESGQLLSIEGDKARVRLDQKFDMGNEERTMICLLSDLQVETTEGLEACKRKHLDRLDRLQREANERRGRS